MNAFCRDCSEEFDCDAYMECPNCGSEDYIEIEEDEEDPIPFPVDPPGLTETTNWDGHSATNVWALLNKKLEGIPNISDEPRVRPKVKSFEEEITDIHFKNMAEKSLTNNFQVMGPPIVTLEHIKNFLCCIQLPWGMQEDWRQAACKTLNEAIKELECTK